MAGLLQRAIGGALKGLGDGIVEQARQRREDALMQLGIQTKREDAATAHRFDQENIDQRGKLESDLKDKDFSNQKDRDATQHNYRMEEGDADADNRIRAARTEHDMTSGDVNGLFTADNGDVYAQTKRGLLPQPNIKGANKTDKQLLDDADAYASTTKKVTADDGSITQEKVTDPKKAIQYLKQHGREDLAVGFFPPPNKSAVDYLRKNPGLSKDFDQKYGPGAAKKALGQ